MKFCKRYQEYMRNQEKKLPGVEFKKLKKILKRCRKKVSVQKEEGFLRDSRCPSKCPVCDGTFFPSLLDEMSAVVSCFNERAQKLMKFHLASSFQKFFIQFKSKLQGNHIALVKEGHDLVTYAIINSIAIRKILKKYDKVHYSKQGQAFRSEAQKLHVEILQSPWLLRVNGISHEFNKPTLSCSLFDSVKLNFDLTCSICLDTVFDPVALACGHIFCYMCACSAASVTIVDGLKSADGKSKCPLCREEGVYGSAVHLEELNNLLSQSCRDYWEQRTKSERQERIRQVKEHWESQCRAFVGV